MTKGAAMHETNELGRLFTASRVIPILTVDDSKVAVELARALAAGGLTAVEVTLRTPPALDCVRAIAEAAPEVLVGAGTILTPQQMDKAEAAGARFLVSPGATEELIGGARGRVWLPGIGTASEAMRLAEAGFVHQKFFPAEPSGGIAVLKALAPVLPMIRFCPTGGVDSAKAAAYLDLDNVFAVGGSWVTPPDALARGDYSSVTRLAREAATLRPAARQT